MPAKNKSNFKIMACFDTETNNDKNIQKASAICYQLSVLNNHLVDLRQINNDNVHENIEITIDRDYKDICNRFDELIYYGRANGIVPVIMVHNLAFEMWIISSYINAHNSKACCKSTVKPLTITILSESGVVPELVFWDTLSFYGKSLETLGDECKYPKLSGCWDYLKYRTPDTPLTEMELAYAREDVTVPWVYLGYYLRMNPEIDEHDLACRLLTKTSVVRYKSSKRCGGIHVGNKTTGFMWMRNNRHEKPKSNFELEITHAATRGGFTYCSMKSASRLYKAQNGYHIYKYDANSMHICHALSHYVPANYRECDSRLLLKAFDTVASKDLNYVIEHYENPFSDSMFFGKFKFTNIRVKKGTLFEKNMVTTFAKSRFFNFEEQIESSEDNEGGAAFKSELSHKGWHDWASDDAVFAFGKFYSASECVLILSELSAWELVQQYDYDSVEAIGNGFLTGHSMLSSDKVILSFNDFYRAKTMFKHAMNKYKKNETLTDDDFSPNVPDYLKEAMIKHDPSIELDMEAFYLSVKGELNSLYGIEATNEAKNDIILTKSGLEIGEYKGVEGLPNNPKAWYQYGAHIVGWSRIHQLLFMLLLDDVVDAFICGDTDSHKIYTKASLDEISKRLEPLHKASEKSLKICTSRSRKIKDWFPMSGLGFYEFEGECDEFFATWNKSYIQLHDGKIDITIAGIPADAEFRMPDGKIVNHSFNRIANLLYAKGESFDDIANTLLGYNTYIMHSVTGLNMRSRPEWCEFDEVTMQPRAIYLYPMAKVIGDTRNKENAINCYYAQSNNPFMDYRPHIIDWPADKEEPDIIYLDIWEDLWYTINEGNSGAILC